MFSFSIPSRQLGHSDVEFTVREGKEDKDLLGTVKVSKGALVLVLNMLKPVTGFRRWLQHQAARMGELLQL
jgi:hypothetical protein